MTRRKLLLGLAVAVVLCIVIAVRPASEPGPSGERPGGPVVAENVSAAKTAGAAEKRVISTVVSAAANAKAAAEVTVDYPQDQSIFPPDMVAPRFLWHDAAPTDRWVIDVALDEGAAHLYALSEGPPLPQASVDKRCVAPTNELPKLTSYQASAKTWMPGDDVWEAVKAGSAGKPVVVTLYGWKDGSPDRVLSKGQVTFSSPASCFRSS